MHDENMRLLAKIIEESQQSRAAHERWLEKVAKFSERIYPPSPCKDSTGVDKDNSQNRPKDDSRRNTSKNPNDRQID
jgi:hypothetical protein